MFVAEARGIVRLVLEQNDIPIKEFTPLQVKDAVTGYGKAGKKQVQESVKILCNLESIPKPDDAADAIAIAIASYL
jgi:crossover junction endodeoxyribonuclease RuvC